jgi:tetratricopeptide (TPR) repeat protein
MQHRLTLRLLSQAAFAAVLLLGAATAKAETQAPTEDAGQLVKADTINTFSGAFLAARTADVDQDYANAVILYKRALDFDAENADIEQRLMISYLLNGDFKDGARLAEKLKKDDSIERVTTVIRGLNAIKGKEYNAAKQILKYEGPNDLDKMMNELLIAWAEAGAGKPKEGIALINKMKGPKWYGIFKNYNAGAMSLVAGDIAGARKYWNDAILDRPGGATAPDTYFRSVLALAALEAGQGNTRKALDAISVGDDFFNNYAPLKALRDEVNKGGKPAQQITNATEGAAGVLFSIGGALNRGGSEDIVSLYLQAARALDPKSADTLILLGGIAEDQKKTEKAIAYYKDVPEGSPMRRLSELQLALTLSSTGEVDQAKQHMDKLIAADPTDIRSYLTYGAILSDAKDYKAMAANYDKAVEVIGPVPRQNDWQVFFQRGIAYERLKEWPKAEPNFLKALELSPDQPQVLNYLGYSWVDMNMNLDKGLEMIQKAVDLRPDDGYIVDSLGWAYYRMGRYDDAVNELERAIQLNASDPTINDHLGDAYWRVGRKLEAIYQWNQTLAFKPEEGEIVKIQNKIANGLPPIQDEDAQSSSTHDAPTPPPAEEDVPGKNKS